MKLKIIYEPRGRAREYAPLALNLFAGCTHGCLYCYVPDVLRVDRTVFHSRVVPKGNALERLAADATLLAGDKRTVLMSFACDPYPPGNAECCGMTADALRIMADNKMRVAILTKNAHESTVDLALLQRMGWWYGMSLVWASDAKRAEWEPGTSDVLDRQRALGKARKMGVHTWVSLEPVIDCGEALEVIRMCRQFVDYWKIGKINYAPDLERQDWREFVAGVARLLPPERYLLKDGLKKAAGRVSK